MDPEPDVNDAITTATRHTRDAQETVGEYIAERQVPPLPLVDTVVQRADDLSDLAEQATEGEERSTPSSTS